MEFEQLVNRLDWLEKEYRKTKDALTALEEQTVSLETSVNAAAKQIKGLGKEVSEVSSIAPRIDQFDSMIVKVRSELTKLVEQNEKNTLQREQEEAKQQQKQRDEINKSLADLKKNLNPADIKKKFKENESENQRMVNNIAALKDRVEDVLQASDGVIQGQKLIDTARKNDLKVIADLQGEVTALRKRVDESRDKTTLFGDSLKNLEKRISELLSSELERKQTQTSFFEQNTIAQRDREKAFKEWDEKYAEFQKETGTLQSKVLELDDTLRAAKKAQEMYVELNTKLERRINEVTEMQRLAEDRLRQEWLTFKAEDQKRWTGYTLSSEETGRDMRKDLTKVEERLTTLSDASQFMQDQLHQSSDLAEKKLEELVNINHEWKESLERIMGHSKAKKTKK